MIKRLLLSGALLATALQTTAYSQNYRKVSVKDVMKLSSDSLSIGSMLSPQIGDTVLLTGVVCVPTLVNTPTGKKVQLWSGNRYVTFLRDTSASVNEFAGINILQVDTTNKTLGMDRIQSGDVIEVLVRIENFPVNADPKINRLGGLQGNVVTGTKGIPVEVLAQNRTLPALPAANVKDFVLGAAATAVPQFITGAKYYGMKVEFSGLSVIANSPNVILGDDEGNQMYLRDQSGYFTTRAHQLRTYDPTKVFPVGQKINKMRGFITANTVAGTVIPFIITPADTNDVEKGDAPIVLSQVFRDRTNPFPNPTQTVPVTFLATKGTNDIDPTKIGVEYSTDGQNYTLVGATVNGTQYSASIPAQPANTLVRWRATATDSKGVTIRFPVTGAFQYRVLDRKYTIQDIREPLNRNGQSAYSGFNATIEGVIMSDSGDVVESTIRRYYIQDGVAPYSGMYIVNNDPAYKPPFKRGDRISISGVLSEANNNTNLVSTSTVSIISSGNILNPIVLKTTDFQGKLQGDTTVDKWRSMLVEFRDVVVSSTNADAPSNFGEFAISDGNNTSATFRIETDDSRVSIIKVTAGKLPQLGKQYSAIRGFLYYSFGNYKLVPRRDDDFVTGVSSVDEEAKNNNVLISPNPVRDFTTVRYTLSSPTERVEIKVVNALGKVVVSSLSSLQGMTTTTPNSTNADEYAAQINVNGLENGAYTVVISTEKGIVATAKFIVVK